MKNFEVKVIAHRTFWATVEAKDEEEAKQKAMNWENILEEKTIEEDITEAKEVKEA